MSLAIGPAILPPPPPFSTATTTRYFGAFAGAAATTHAWGFIPGAFSAVPVFARIGSLVVLRGCHVPEVTHRLIPSTTMRRAYSGKSCVALTFGSSFRKYRGASSLPVSK